MSCFTHQRKANPFPIPPVPPIIPILMKSCSGNLIIISIQYLVSLLSLFLFLRHAQATNNVNRILAGRSTGYQLTDLGAQQAEKIGDFLKPLSIARIYSSPIERAEQTAKIVSNKIGLDYNVDERIIRNASLTILKNEQSNLSVVAINSMCAERYSQE